MVGFRSRGRTPNLLRRAVGPGKGGVGYRNSDTFPSIPEASRTALLLPPGLGPVHPFRRRR